MVAVNKTEVESDEIAYLRKIIEVLESDLISLKTENAMLKKDIAKDLNTSEHTIEQQSNWKTVACSKRKSSNYQVKGYEDFPLLVKNRFEQ